MHPLSERLSFGFDRDVCPAPRDVRAAHDWLWLSYVRTAHDCLWLSYVRAAHDWLWLSDVRAAHDCVRLTLLHACDLIQCFSDVLSEISVQTLKVHNLYGLWR
jgi:hypothetical protein